jgi:hypothetical protein
MISLGSVLSPKENGRSLHSFLSRMGSLAGSCWRAYYLVLKGHALGIVFREPGFRGVGICKDLECSRSPTCLLLSTYQHGHGASLSDNFGPSSNSVLSTSLRPNSASPPSRCGAQSAVLITGFHFFKKGARPQKSAYQLVGARQILQCVGKIKIGSSAQALYHPPNFRRQGKPNGITPVLSSSPTSKSQSSGASWIGSHRRARHDIPESLKGACN